MLVIVLFGTSMQTGIKTEIGHLKLKLLELVVGKFIQGVVIHMSFSQAMKNHHQFHTLAKYSH